jgi:hypothetical protein
MKRGVICFLLFFLTFSAVLKAQINTNKNSISYKFLVTDYNTIDPKYRQENPKRYFHPDDINYAADLGYFRYLNSSFNVGATVRFGSLDAYHNLIDSTDANCIGQPCSKRYFRNEMFGGINVLGKYKFNNGYLLKEDFFVAPYVLTGISALYMHKRKGHFDMQIPFGIGLNIRLNPLFNIQTQFDYNQSLIIKKNNFAISFGFIWTLGKHITVEKVESTEIETVD